MNDGQKQFWVCTKSDGEKEIVWNWEHNMHGGLYPEYVNIDGPFTSRSQAEQNKGFFKNLNTLR